MEALGWILITGAFCALSGGLSWLFMPQHARGSFKGTLWTCFSFGCAIQVVIQIIVRTQL